MDRGVCLLRPLANHFLSENAQPRELALPGAQSRQGLDHTVSDHFDGHSARHFARIVAAHTVTHQSQTLLLANDEGVLVGCASFPDVGSAEQADSNDSRSPREV